jgi:hypothetical protein
MNYHLREILDYGSEHALARAMPWIQDGLDIALNGFPVSVDNHWAVQMIDEVHLLDGLVPDIGTDPVPGEKEVWVEFLSDVSMTPLEGQLPGTHVLYGSAIQNCASGASPVYDMFTFFAVTEGTLTEKGFAIDRVLGVHSSPIQCRVSHIDQAEPPVWQYRCIADISADDDLTDLYRRDMVIHRLAFKYLKEAAGKIVDTARMACAPKLYPL